MLFFLLIAVVLSAQERTLLRTREVKERALLDQKDATIWGRLIEESSSIEAQLSFQFHFSSSCRYWITFKRIKLQVIIWYYTRYTSRS